MMQYREYLSWSDTLSASIAHRAFRCLLGFGLVLFGYFSITSAFASTAVITLSIDEGPVGTSITVQGSNFAPLAEVTIEFGEDELASALADNLGKFASVVEVPMYSTAGSATITATDDSAGGTTASLEFTVINSPPVADSQPEILIEENESEMISLTASDVNGDVLDLEIADNPSHGTLSEIDQDTGEVEYDPDPGYQGPDSFSFKANDGVVYSSETVVSLTVTEENQPPTVTDIEVFAVEDSEVVITLEATDADSPSVALVLASGPEHGTLDYVVATGPYSASVAYFPDPNYAGHDSFLFMAQDSDQDSAEATVEITIQGVNDPPVALAKSVTINENSKKKITLEGYDADGDSLSFSMVSQPDHGNLTGSPPTPSYEPDDGYVGEDSFRFTVSDAKANGNTATVSIDVVADDYVYEDYDDDESYYDHTNHAPVANSQSVSGAEDNPFEITLSADDADDDLVTFGITEYPLHGVISDFDESTGNLEYWPEADYSGTDSFTFSSMDNYRESKRATVSISVTAVNDLPRAISMNLTTIEGRVNVTLAGFDPEGSSVQFALFGQPANGTLLGIAPDLVYVADPAYSGYDSFLFSVYDSEQNSNIGVVSIMVGLPAMSQESDDGTPGHSNHSKAEPSGSDKSKQENSDKDKPGPESSTKVRADKSKVLVMLSWEHHNKKKGVDSTLHIKFAEHRTRAPLDSHIWYDFVMLDSDNKEILRKNDLVALNSEDVQEITFPANGTYNFEVNVKGLIDKTTNAISRNTDYTGKALGIVVVPEFNSAWVLVILAAIMTPIVIARYRGYNAFPQRISD